MRPSGAKVKAAGQLRPEAMVWAPTPAARTDGATTTESSVAATIAAIEVILLVMVGRIAFPSRLDGRGHPPSLMRVILSQWGSACRAGRCARADRDRASGCNVSSVTACWTHEGDGGP